MRKSLLIISMLFSFGYLQAQDLEALRRVPSGSQTQPIQPFAFSVTTLTAASPAWGVNYSGSYGQRTSGAFGYDGVDQQLAIKGYLGNRFTVFANASVGFANNGRVNSAQQAEILRDLIGGKKAMGARLGLSMGVSRDWDNVKSLFSRVTASVDIANWRMGGNMRFEKAFDSSRDKVDFITSVGIHRKISGIVYGGLEAVGQDLEGFWEKDEAEGGAKLLLGPSINISNPNSKFSFSACGGPVFYATRSTVAPSAALRDLNTSNGYTVRAMVSFNLH
jgi:hypothetical protein